MISNPGKFRHGITFLSPPDDRDEYGQPVEDWVIFKTVKASKEPLIGKELYTALTAGTKVETRITSKKEPK